jgi:hypothetical protein
MSSLPGARFRSVLETSFWTAAYRAEVVANCLDLFEIVVPRAVEAEIRARDPAIPSREYPYATLFRHLRGQMADPPVDAPPPLTVFGPGEAEAISLAGHLHAPLLVNERPAAQFAERQGITVVSVPSVIITLRALGVISRRAARRKLDLIEPITAREIVREARLTLDALRD